jgi:hypothetical protein
MCFHWSGFAVIPGIVILAADIAVSIPIIMFIVLFIIVTLVGSAIWRARTKWKRSGLSIAEFTKAQEQLAAEQVRKAAEAWTFPPELNLPTPRPVRSAPAGIRLLRSLPRCLFLIVLAIFIYTIAFLYTHTTQVTRDESVPSYLFHVSRQMFDDFLHAPQWQSWMLWPSVIFAGLAGLSVLPGHFRQQKEKKLLRWGKPARAVVTKILTKYGGRNASGVTQSKLEYHDDAGNNVEVYVARLLSQDQVLTVLYDPDKPSRFTTYPVGGFVVGKPGSS